MGRTHKSCLPLLLPSPFPAKTTMGRTMERILAPRQLLLAIWAIVLLVAPIDAQPSGTCYSDADALNADLSAFAETDPNIFLDNDSVAFKICPGTVWDVSNVALYVINLREEFPIILSCGDFYSTAVDERQEQEAPVCVLTGTGTVDGSQVTVKGSVRFVGLTFTEFSGSAIGIPEQWGEIPSRVEFSHCRFEVSSSLNCTARRYRCGCAPPFTRISDCLQLFSVHCTYSHLTASRLCKAISPSIYGFSTRIL